MSSDRPDRILRLPFVIERTGLSRSTVYRKVAEQSFPKPLKISDRCIGWRESDIEGWLSKPSSGSRPGSRH